MPAFYLPPPCPNVRYRSEPGLEAQRVCMNLGVRTRAHERGTYLFLAPGNTGVGVYSDTGVLVWWHRPFGGGSQYFDARVVRLWGRSYLAVWSGHVHLFGSNHGQIRDGTVVLYDEHYRRVGTITAGAPFRSDQLDMHEFQVTSGGDVLVDVYRPVAMTVSGRRVIVFNCVVQKLSLVRDSHGIHTGRVLFQWSSLKHVPVTTSRLPEPPAGGAWDYFHVNSMTQDSDGNLVLSARNTWGVYKVNVRTGHIMWQLGARGDPTLHVPWCYQHDITALGHDEYTLFDDGGEGPGCWPQLNWHPARGLIFRVDPRARPARIKLVRSFTHRPAIHSELVGNFQHLDDGNVLVSWGTTPELTEYTPAGRVLMDLSLSQQSYRGFRFGWVGRPLTPPSVAAQVLPDGDTRVWASWNGSTEVRAWRVLAGSSRAHLRPVARPVRKTAFETAVVLAHHYRMVAVQALAASGRALARSKPVTPASS